MHHLKPKFLKLARSSMDDAEKHVIFSWLQRAYQDFRTIDILSKSNEPILETAAFHCQQLAEKSLKGYLVFRKQRVQKTHNLSVLVEDAMCHDQEFETLLSAANSLNPFYIEFRYPDAGPMEPLSFDEFQIAHNAAKSIYTFVMEKLPEDLRNMLQK